MKYALVILTLIFSTQSFAFGPCDNPATLQSLWSTKYSSLVSNPLPSVSQNADLSKNENFALRKLAQAFCFIDNAKTLTNFYQYILDMVRVGVLTSGFAVSPSSEADSVANLAEADNNTRGILIFPPFFSNKKDSSDYKRASILIHEVRHLEISKRNKDKRYVPIPNSHVVCTHGAFATLMACDQEFSGDLPNASPYSYEIVFFRNLFDYSPYNVNKRYLAVWTVYILKNSFNYVSPADFKAYTSGFEKYLSGSELSYSQP